MLHLPRNILLLLAAFLCCALSSSQESQNQSRPNQQHTRDQLFRSDVYAEKDKCCLHAFEAQAHDVPEKRCLGTRWGRAIPGSCRDAKEMKCIAGDGRTVVTVHEYVLQWDAKEKNAT